MRGKKSKKIIIIISIIFIILGIVCTGIGFHKIINYRNSDTYPSRNVNAYVGGDAYNYIINAGYFAGYLSLGGSLLIVSAILLSSVINNNQENLEKLIMKIERNREWWKIKKFL